MRNIFYAIVIIYGIVSCLKISDDTNIPCKSDCTVLHGYFISENDEPIKNVKLQLKHRVTNPPLGGTTRIIRNTQTNERGYFNINFFVLDKEFENQRGYYQMDVNLSELDKNTYLISNIANESFIDRLKRRDTIIYQEFYLPTKTSIKVNLKNFIPIQENDYFKVSILFPYGFKLEDEYNEFIGSEYGTGRSNNESYAAIGLNTTIRNVWVAESENNVIIINKRKDGIYTSENYKFFVPKNNQIELNYEY